MAARSLRRAPTNLFERLARNVDRVVSKSDLSEQALGRPPTRFDRSIDVRHEQHPSQVRPARRWAVGIMTVRGTGYQLSGTEPQDACIWKFFNLLAPAWWMAPWVGTAVGLHNQAIATRSVAGRVRAALRFDTALMILESAGPGGPARVV